MATQSTLESTREALGRVQQFDVATLNYSTHKHNAVVNRHRQNALLTYRSLVEASGDAGTEDIILAHAASCIFSPQETGFSYSKGETATGSKSVLELLTKSTSKE